MNSVALIGLAAGSGLLLYALKIFRNDGSPPKPGKEVCPTVSTQQSQSVLRPSDSQRAKEEKHTLEIYSQLWKKDDHKKNTLKELAKIWRNDINDGQSEAPDKPLFLHREIKAFYKDCVEDKPFFVGNALRATVEILQMLDTKGKCPSVVNKHKDEPEKGYDQEVYRVLKKIPLYEHTVNVAREIIPMVPDGPMVPKAVIAALAHDLGKITQFYDRLSATGIHSFIGITALDRMPALQELKYLDEIVDAVKNHHRNPEAQLGQVLKKADQEARRKEIAEFTIDVITLPNQDSTGEHAAVITVSSDTGATEEKPSTHATTTATKPARKPTKKISDLMGAGIDTTSTAADLFGEEASVPAKGENDLMGEGSNKASSSKIRKVNIPWFEFDAAITQLGEVVNRLVGPRWGAVSMNEGTIYVRQETLFSLAEKLSGNSPDIKLAKSDPQTKTNIIYSMVLAFRSAGAIENTMCSENYPGALFVINPGEDASYEIYLTPFKAESFKIPLSDMDKKKSDTLRNNVKAIKLKAILEAD